MGARGENGFKLVQMNLERIWRKEIQKKMKRGRRCRANPASLSAQRAARPTPPLPLSPTRGRASLHPAPATWRPYAGVGRAAAGVQPPWSGRRLGLPGHFLPPVTRALLLPPSARAAQQRQLRRTPLPENVPPLAADRTRAPSSQLMLTRAPAHSPSLRLLTVLNAHN